MRARIGKGSWIAYDYATPLQRWRLFVAEPGRWKPYLDGEVLR